MNLFPLIKKQIACSLLLGVLALVLLPSVVLAEDSALDIELGEEYSGHERSTSAVTPKRPLWKKIIFYLPSRALDLIDIVRIDVGVGLSTGVVARVTKWGQVGYRTMSPASLRVGLRGRKLPIFIERSSEFGIGPAFVQSHDRVVTPLELGLGADVLIAGAYLGVSIDELVDFLGGWVGIDFKDDDL